MMMEMASWVEMIFVWVKVDEICWMIRMMVVVFVVAVVLALFSDPVWISRMMCYWIHY